MNDIHTVIQNTLIQSNSVPTDLKAKYNKKILFSLISMIGITIFGTAQSYAQCSLTTVSASDCYFDHTQTAFVSTFSGTTINQDGYINNNNTEAVEIQTSENELNGTLTIRNEANAGNLKVNINNKNINNIYAENYGNGAMVIKLSEDINATNQEGIHIINSNTASDMDISAHSIYSNSKGIYAVNSGNGSTVITSDGEISSINDNGIYIFNDAQTTGLTIHASTVTGKAHAIYAQNNGQGSTDIVVQQKLTSSNGNGVYVDHGANTTDLNIHTNMISAGQEGIHAHNAGTGSTTITADGEIEALNGDAVHVENGNNTHDVNIHTQTYA